MELSPSADGGNEILPRTPANFKGILADGDIQSPVPRILKNKNMIVKSS